jgi:hypothetical protein
VRQNLASIPLSGVRAGDEAAHGYVDFRPGVKGFAARFATVEKPRIITDYAGNASGPPVGVPGAEMANAWVS